MCIRDRSQAFDAQVALDDGDWEAAEELAYQAMLSAARALVRLEFIDVTEDPDEIVREFKTRFYDTEIFFHRFSKGAFANHLLDRHANPPDRVGRDEAAARVEESQLFIEACHACEAKLDAAKQAGGGVSLEAPANA